MPVDRIVVAMNNEKELTKLLRDAWSEAVAVGYAEFPSMDKMQTAFDGFLERNKDRIDKLTQI